MDWPFQRLFPVTELLEESKRIMRLLPVGGCYVPPDPATLGKSGSRGRCEVDRGLGSVKAPGHRSRRKTDLHKLHLLSVSLRPGFGGCGTKSRPEAAKLQPPCPRWILWLTFLWLSCLCPNSYEIAAPDVQIQAPCHPTPIFLARGTVVQD